MCKYLFLFTILFTSTAYAVPCDFITNSDIKNFCYALKDKSDIECNFIQDNDIKYACLAEVNKNSNECEYISDNDLRYLCKMRSEL